MSRHLLILLFVSSLTACGGLPPSSAPAEPTGYPHGRDARAQEIVLYALGLLDTGYRFGGKNPAAGLDCSGMVSYIFDRAAGLKLEGSAADLAKQGRPVDRRALLPGDLVFFNTRGRSFSHVGIYIGDNRFVHAPNDR